jgi:hypothetical protein
MGDARKENSKNNSRKGIDLPNFTGYNDRNKGLEHKF